MIYSRTEFGSMIDFLKANPSVTMQSYMWEWTVPQIRLASADCSHVRYLTEKQAEMRKARKFDGNDFEALNDLGVPIFGLNNN
jgi:hypothetical protein